MTTLLSAVNILALSLSVIIVIAAVVVATTTPSAAILLNSNGNIILAKKNTSGNELKVSHKLGGVTARRDSNNNIRSKNSVSAKKEVPIKLGGRSGDIIKKFNIAIIKPTFTAAAYDNSFYKFFLLFAHTQLGMNVTTYLSLLSNKMPKHLTSSSAPSMSFLPHHFKMLLPKSSIDVLNDADVDSGYIFKKME